VDPGIIQNLISFFNTTSISLNWTAPPGQVFTYKVEWCRGGCQNSSIIFVNKSFAMLSDLIPGSSYTINITAVAKDNHTLGEPYTSIILDCKKHFHYICHSSLIFFFFLFLEPDVVKNLRIVSVTTTSVSLSWDKPEGSADSYIVRWNSTKENSSNKTNSLSFNITNLTPGVLYNISVTAVAGNEGNQVFNKTFTSGFTDSENLSKYLKSEPAIPSNYLSMANVSATEYHKFTIVVSRDLLNKSSGPITHVGVLLTQSIAGLVLADVCPCVCDAARPTFSFCCCFSEGKACDKAYLTKTYNDRKSGSLEAYLTAVQTPVTGTRSASNLIIDVGTSATWESYVNGELEEGQTYRYALLQHISWMFDGKDSSQHPLSRSAAVRVEDFEAYYQKQKADSNCGFAEEFEDLKVVGTSQAKVHALNPSNKPKNRYNNVLPYDSSRVKLSIIHGDPCDDYINANYMPGYQSKKEFIAAQGPLPGTVNDFWRMIWEKNVRTMVMLTRCNEQGRVKCEQYWASGVKSCGDIIVKTTSDIILDDWTIKDFNIKNVKTAEMRAVRHFHFTAWPDHGVPETTELLISFRHLVREHMDQYSQHSPTVVHCSAGVGRTGTFIAIDRLIFQIERENIVDIFGIVHNLRMHRPLMVQTEDQYVFLNQCALDFIRSRTGNNVDLIYQNTAALSIYENISPKKRGY
uniref:protein-tyrosine-phosphatase n=1 Tax=Oryzias sinensis TaxID=183150 RepID=A0A8C7Y9S0_9TELE